MCFSDLDCLRNILPPITKYNPFNTTSRPKDNLHSTACPAPREDLRLLIFSVFATEKNQENSQDFSEKLVLILDFHFSSRVSQGSVIVV